MRHRLKELRKEFNLTQKDIYKDICSRNSYSRFENNKQPIPFEMLDQFLKRMGITFHSYLQFLEKYEQKNIYQLIESQLLDLIKKDKQAQELFLKTEFKLVQQNRFKNIYALLVFIQVKSMFVKYLKVKLSPLTKLDLIELEEFYAGRNYILPIDLAILGNLVPSYSCKELQKLENLITKNIKNNASLDLHLKKLGNVYLNFSIKAIRENDFIYTKHYLEKLKKISYKENDYQLKLSYLYFLNLANFMETNDFNYLQKANEIIQIIQKIGDNDYCASLLEEMNLLLQNKKVKIPSDQLTHSPIIYR